MLKPTGLLAASGILAILGGVMWWSGKQPKKPETTTPPAPKILDLKEDQVEAIRIAKTGSDPIVVKKVADTWVIAEPKQLPADQDAVKGVVATAASMTADRLIDEKPTGLAGFGLTNPVTEVDVTLKGGAVNKVLFGSDTPTGSDSYAKLDSSPKVYTVFSSTKTSFDKTVNDLRDKRLLTFNSDKVTSVSVTSKGPAFEIGKNAQNEWQITKPRPLRADSPQVDDFVRKLKDARMDLTATTEPTGGTLVGSATVTDNTGPQTITVYKAKDNSYYAKSTAAQGTYKLTGDLGDGIKEKDVDSFRNKKIFDFNFTDPTKIEINGTAYSKSGDKWTGPSGQMDSSSIQTVIDKLRDLSAAKFSDKMTGTQSLTLAVTAGDNHKMEKVVINKGSDGYDAQRDGDPSIYVVDAKAYDDLQKDIAAIKPYQASKPGATGRK